MTVLSLAIKNHAQVVTETNTKLIRGKEVAVDCRRLSPEKPHTYPSPRRKEGFFTAAGNTPSSHLAAMTLDTQMTLALLQKLLLALRANDAEGFKGWFALGLEEIGRQVVK